MTRLARLQNQLKSANVDVLALAPGDHMRWLMGFNPHGDERPLLLCVTQEAAGFLMPALEAESAAQHTDLPFYQWADEDGPAAAFDALLEALGASNASSIALDETMRADHAALVQDRLMNARRQFTETTIGALRMQKDEEDYKHLKYNAQTADKAMKAAWSQMRVGMREVDVAAIVRDAFKDQDVKPLFTLVCAGKNGAFPHHQTGETTLAEGDVVVMDIGGTIDANCSDITRMAVMGAPSAEYEKVHAIVNAAVEAALAAAKPGVTAKTVDAAARQVISEAGYGAYFVHRTGHGLGTTIHEPPYITATSETVLQEGMVFSIEPGIYIPGHFGLRLEEIVFLRADGPEVLSDLPRDTQIIPV